MTIKSMGPCPKRMFLLSSSVALLMAAGMAQAASCDNSVNCESHVTITLTGGKCYYSWPTRSYEVAKLTQPKLFWSLDDANSKWDPGNGVRLAGNVNDPDHDLKDGHAESDTVFVWKSVQLPIDPSAGDLPFSLRMYISHNGSTCDKATGEPDYQIVLKR